MTKISCLVPFYNEGARVLQVLHLLAATNGIDEIICIDDGSTDNMGNIIKRKFPDLTVIISEQNEGKTAAIRKGLNSASGDLILLMDADLKMIKYSELVKAISVMKTDDSIDMLILRRVNSNWFVKIGRGDILLSGERIIRKKDLQFILKSNAAGYQLEFSINKYMQKKRRKVRWMDWSAQNTYKYEKYGILSGVARDGRMYSEIIGYGGIIPYLRQVTLFARKSVKADTKEKGSERSFRNLFTTYRY